MYNTRIWQYGVILLAILAYILAHYLCRKYIQIQLHHSSLWRRWYVFFMLDLFSF